MISRPASRIVVGESYHDLLDSYEALQSIIEKIWETYKDKAPDMMFEVTRHHNGKKMWIRLGAVDVLMQMGY